MNKGCFGSLLTASEQNPVCLACPDKLGCHEKAKETSLKIYGKFFGFPNDKKNRKAKNT
ncbi:hypothetical protein [Serratia quinivorans]